MKRTHHSRPLVATELTFSSMQAQKVIHRVFYRALRSLYSTEVILRVIAPDEEVDRLESEFDRLMAETSAELDQALRQFESLAAAEGIAEVPRYSGPKALRLEVSTPRAFRWIRLVERLDALMQRVDALWFGQVIDGKARKRAGYEWQRKVLRTGWAIVELERTAHRKARAIRKAKEAERKDPASLGLVAEPTT